MLIPSTSSSPPPETLASISQAQELDKSLIDRALTREIASDLPAFYQMLRSLALTSERDSDKISALTSLLDRAAGKPSQTITHHGAIGRYEIPQDEVLRRLNHLRAME